MKPRELKKLIPQAGYWFWGNMLPPIRKVNVYHKTVDIGYSNERYFQQDIVEFAKKIGKKGSYEKIILYWYDGPVSAIALVDGKPFFIGNWFDNHRSRGGVGSVVAIEVDSRLLKRVCLSAGGNNLSVRMLEYVYNHSRWESKSPLLTSGMYKLTFSKKTQRTLGVSVFSSFF